MASLRAFFESPSADRLMDGDRYPPAIHEFLREERRMLDSLTAACDVLIEVGCMNGRHLDWAIDRGRRYIGIDLVRRHIREGRRTVASRGLCREAYRFVCGDAASLDALLERRVGLGPSDRGLVFFPFNVLGAVPDIGAVIASVRRSRQAFLISAYQTTDEATVCRFEYYRACGYPDLRMSRTAQGVMFETSDGFRTIAYDQRHLQELCRSHGLAASSFVWGRSNVVYAPASLLAMSDLCQPLFRAGPSPLGTIFSPS